MQPIPKLYSVLTGDLIASSQLKLSEHQQVELALKDIFERLGDVISAKCVVQSTTLSRGDSWQLLIDSAKVALKAATFIRASLRGGEPSIDTRIAIGIGPVDSLGEPNKNSGLGKAFTLSGQALDALKEEGKVPSPSLTLRTSDSLSGSASRTAAEFLGLLIDSWTDKQCRAIAGEMRGLTQKMTGELWTPPIHQVSVLEHLKSARWAEIARCLDLQK